MYLLKLSLRPWRLAPFSQAFSALAVGLLLFMVAFLIWLQAGLKPVIARLQGEQVVTAYLKPDVPKKDESQIVDSIRESVGSQSVSEIALVDAPKFINLVEKHYPDLAHELAELGSETNIVVPRYVSVTGLFDSEALEKIRGTSGIESAETSRDRYRPVLGAFRVLRWVARFLALGLCVALMTGLIHLARMNSYIHQDAISLLRLWGAGAGTQNFPGMLSGFFVGISGGAMAALVWVTAGVWLSGHIRGLSPLLRGMPIASPAGMIFLIFSGAALGVLAGLTGAIQPSQAGSRA